MNKKIEKNNKMKLRHTLWWVLKLGVLGGRADLVANGKLDLKKSFDPGILSFRSHFRFLGVEYGISWVNLRIIARDTLRKP